MRLPNHAGPGLLAQILKHEPSSGLGNTQQYERDLAIYRQTPVCMRIAGLLRTPGSRIRATRWLAMTWRG
jgi:hypothetical protein